MKSAQNAISEKINWYRGLPILGTAGIWFVFLMSAAYLALQIFIHWVIGVANYERKVEVRTRHYEAKLTVFNSGAFSSYKTLMEVRPRNLYSKPCRAFYILRSGPKTADIHWELGSDTFGDKRELVVTLPESAEVTPLNQCKDVTFTFVRVPSAEKED